MASSTESALTATLRVVASMQEEGLIETYAICGAVAALVYIEPFMTHDLDVSIYLPDTKGRLVTLTPFADFLARKGLPVVWHGEALVIGRWPVQFIFADDALDRAALSAAQTIDLDGIAARVWRMEHLMAKCLAVGRPKDIARLELFLNEAFDRPLFCDILARFELLPKWRAHLQRYGRDDVCRLSQ